MSEQISSVHNCQHQAKNCKHQCGHYSQQATTNKPGHWWKGALTYKLHNVVEKQILQQTLPHLLCHRASCLKWGAQGAPRIKIISPKVWFCIEWLCLSENRQRIIKSESKGLIWWTKFMRQNPSTSTVPLSLRLAEGWCAAGWRCMWATPMGKCSGPCYLD